MDYCFWSEHLEKHMEVYFCYIWGEQFTFLIQWENVTWTKFATVCTLEWVIQVATSNMWQCKQNEHLTNLIIQLKNYKFYNNHPKFDFTKLFLDILATKTLKLRISMVIRAYIQYL